jgi:hypothetical protein
VKLKTYRQKNHRNLPRSHFPLTPRFTPSTPLLPALTLSAGESSRWVGLPHNPHARRSKGPRMASLYFWWPPRDPCCVAMVKPPVSLLRVYSACRCLQDGCRIWVCPPRLFCLSCPIYLNTASLPRYFLRPPTAMAKKEITGDEPSAHAKENGCHRGAHRDEDSLRDQNKHVENVKKDQNAAPDRVMSCEEAWSSNTVNY